MRRTSVSTLGRYQSRLRSKLDNPSHQVGRGSSSPAAYGRGRSAARSPEPRHVRMGVPWERQDWASSLAEEGVAANQERGRRAEGAHSRFTPNNWQLARSEWVFAADDRSRPSPREPSHHRDICARGYGSTTRSVGSECCTNASGRDGAGVAVPWARYVAKRWARVGCGRRSPASCSVMNWLNGLSLLKAPMT